MLLYMYICVFGLYIMLQVGAKVVGVYSCFRCVDVNVLGLEFTTQIWPVPNSGRDRMGKGSNIMLIMRLPW